MPFVSNPKEAAAKRVVHGGLHRHARHWRMTAKDRGGFERWGLIVRLQVTLFSTGRAFRTLIR
jgi:hypothetical protein